MSEPSTSTAAAATKNTLPAPTAPFLRLVRHWRWVHAPGVEVRVGGPAALQLEHHDVLETLFEGKWVPVPVVEMDKPEHPAVAARREEELRRHAAISGDGGDGNAMVLREGIRQFLGRAHEASKTSRGYTDQFRLPDTLPPTDDKGG